MSLLEIGFILTRGLPPSIRRPVAPTAQRSSEATCTTKGTSTPNIRYGEKYDQDVDDNEGYEKRSKNNPKLRAELEVFSHHFFQPFQPIFVHQARSNKEYTPKLHARLVLDGIRSILLREEQIANKRLPAPTPINQLRRPPHMRLTNLIPPLRLRLSLRRRRPRARIPHLEPIPNRTRKIGVPRRLRARHAKHARDGVVPPLHRALHDLPPAARLEADEDAPFDGRVPPLRLGAGETGVADYHGDEVDACGCQSALPSAGGGGLCHCTFC
ncbi:hypothetical protein CVT26_013299 [Gymnopilus dilepis]|uniref:Uncharacterized protein n=1 Tax=Gymnopilus dilepis TaxID=231916 RepID=A0A409VUN3_9AGAR|nr:hypothetical protein CVT26_013299 [Gymnopilus dilepis]